MEEKKTSTRVRFLMQDVIELKQNCWRKRREDAGPDQSGASDGGLQAVPTRAARRWPKVRTTVTSSHI